MRQRKITKSEFIKQYGDIQVSYDICEKGILLYRKDLTEDEILFVFTKSDKDLQRHMVSNGKEQVKVSELSFHEGLVLDFKENVEIRTKIVARIIEI